MISRDDVYRASGPGNIETISVEEYRRILAHPKLRLGADTAPRTDLLYAGYRFHSLLEVEVARALDLLLHNGTVAAWQRGESYELIPATGGEPAITYTPDFAVAFGPAGAARLVVIEVKPADKRARSNARRDWPLRRRLFKWRYPELDLRVISGSGQLLDIAKEVTGHE